ncbi:MAG: pilus assembly protein N-terminal domain-containing protein [Pirellulales bacterium]|nr:pilus assembly protein N-terminal domain-containing protein [Pirellulales bacterium]
MASHTSRSFHLPTRRMAAVSLGVLVALASASLGQSTLRLAPQTLPPRTVSQPASLQYQYPAYPPQVGTYGQIRIAQAATPTAPLTPSAGRTPPPSGIAPTASQPQPPIVQPGEPQLVRQLTSTNERMEMIINTTRILALDQRITRIGVNNPEILQPTILAPNQVQIEAKKAGLTHINLWTASGQIYSVGVIVNADARELDAKLQALFPGASLKVVPVANSIFITGYIDEPEHVDHVIRIAEEYYAKVINNITVAGVQQVLLHVKVMEVSRTKLRTMGFDWTQLSGNSIVASSVAGLLGAVAPASEELKMVGGIPVLEITPPQAAASGNQTFAFNVTEGSNAFFGILEALRRNNLLKILSEPTLTTVSGRPATFNVGGEIPILVPQSLGTVSIEFKKYGTQLDFIPIVLGNGKIRLEVRPKISEIDPSNSIVLQGITVPGLRSREVETAVELQAGQTLAIAGLVQTRVEAESRGLPILGEAPYIGAMFRRVEERLNEIELLIMVTPEIVDAMNPDEVPECGPGMRTTSPSDHELYWKGHIEVPNCCPSGSVADSYPGGQAVPGMTLEPSPEPMGSVPRLVPNDGQQQVIRTAYQTDRSGRYNRTNWQGGVNVRRSSPAPLPGFQGQTGYGVLR